MKMVLICLLGFFAAAAQVNAQNTVERHANGRLNASTLGCRLDNFNGADNLYAVAEPQIVPRPQLEAQHERLAAQSCPRELIRDIKDDAFKMGFGFAIVNLDIIDKFEKPYIDANKSCWQEGVETLIVKLRGGLELSSEASFRHPSMACTP